MIQISLTQAIVLYTAVIGTCALAIWLYTEMRVQFTYHVLEKQHLWRCTFCAYTYLDEAAERLSRCPRCNSFNAIDDSLTREVPVAPMPAMPHASELGLEMPRRNPSRRKRPGAKKKGPRRRR